MTTKKISIETDAGTFRATTDSTLTHASLYGLGVANFSTSSQQGAWPNADVLAFEVTSIEIDETDGGEYGPYLRLRIENAHGQHLRISLQRATLSMLSSAIGLYEMGLEAAAREAEGVSL